MAEDTEKSIEERMKKTRMDQILDIQAGAPALSSEIFDCHRGEHEGITDENIKEHIEECLGEMLYNYNNDERNYALDGAVIKCDQMSDKMVFIQFREDGSKISIEGGGKPIESGYVKPAAIGPERYNPEWEEHIIFSNIEKENIRKLHAAFGNSQSANGIRFATVGDRSYLREEKEKQQSEPDKNATGKKNVAKAVGVGMISANDAIRGNLVSIVSCGNCKNLKEEDIKKIAENWEGACKYGTCYALMKLAEKWENPYCIESVVGECESDFLSSSSGETDNAVYCKIEEHHKPMRFSTIKGEKEGLTMMSTLLCRREGIITIESPGQIYIEPKGEDIDFEWNVNVKEEILKLLEMENGVDLVENYLKEIKENNAGYVKFLEILGEKEGRASGYSSLSKSKTYWGLYQIGPSTLENIGFRDESGNWTDLARKLGLSGKIKEEETDEKEREKELRDSFLNNETAQEVAILFALRWDYLYILDNGDDEYIGTVVNGTEITNSGLIAAGHLVGCKDLHKACAGEKAWENTCDGNGTSALYYMEEMGGLDLSGILVGIEEQIVVKE